LVLENSVKEVEKRVEEVGGFAERALVVGLKRVWVTEVKLAAEKSESEWVSEGRRRESEARRVGVFVVEREISQGRSQSPGVRMQHARSTC
jgi:hypothetical protein